MVVVIISAKSHEKAVFINIAVLIRSGSPVAIISVVLLDDMKIGIVTEPVSMVIVATSTIWING